MGTCPLPGRGRCGDLERQESAIATRSAPIRAEPASGTLDGLPLRECIAGIAVDKALWAGLDRFAVKTYVPASAASRQKGAGAGEGNIDNE